MKKNQPKFIGIGGSGTGLGIITSLLQVHPQVTGEIPALNFFNSSLYEKKGLSWYEKKLHLNSAKPNSGECSPDYLTNKSVASKITSCYPDTKLFVVVRNPLKRAIFEYVQKKATGKIPSKLACAKYLVESASSQTDGFYAQHLHEYFGYYSPLQLYILVYEDFVQDPLGQMQKLYEFLELDKNFIPKKLISFAPPPDEPINPGKIKRLFIFIGKLGKKTFTKKKKPKLFLPEIVVSEFLSAKEQSIFSDSFASDAIHLSNLLHRDMVVFWNLSPKSE